MFNIRIYGLWIQKGNILLCEEFIGDRRVIKFPGGGLEFGEGPLDCLLREFNEELGFTPLDVQHFYTTDFFVQSIVRESDQIISIYYLVSDSREIELEKYNTAKMRFQWKPLQELTEEDVSLPIDKVVVKMLNEGRSGK